MNEHTDSPGAPTGIIERLEKMLSDGADDVQLRFGLASACFREGRFDAAREHASVAVERDPDYSAAWRLLARSLIELNETAAARDALEKGIAVAQRHGDMQLVKEMKVFLGRLQRGQG